MCIGPEEGCHEVPETIAAIDVTLVSLDPTRTPMSSPVITISGPMFILPFMSMPGISRIGLAEGLAEGIGIFMSIFGFGEACGFGDGVGICIPGMFICIFGDGSAAGMFISIFC